MKGRRMETKAKDIDGYLSSVHEDARVVLEKLRRTIAAAAPRATEAISYGMPTFKYNGLLVAFAAFKDHCSLFPMSTKVMGAFEDELRRFDTSKGTIRFSIENPPSAGLVRKIVRARIRENDAKVNARQSRKKKR
jgi:uncharacterized protein YdhG (YjbR/CyaY superfamily)